MKKPEIKSKQTDVKKVVSSPANPPSSKESSTVPMKPVERSGQSPSFMSTGQSPDTRKSTGKTPADQNGLRGLFVNQLQGIYWAERALNEKLPELINKVSSRELADALHHQLSQTEKQIARCEDVFEQLNVKAVPHPSPAMEGLIRDANELIDATTPGSVRDAGIICSAQKLDHYKIATYGTLTAFASQLGEKASAKLLKETLQQEKQADQRLTQMAQYTINEAAALA